MSKVVYRTKDEIAAIKQLEQFIRPVYPDAELIQEGDEWVIVVNSIS